MLQRFRKRYQQENRIPTVGTICNRSPWHSCGVLWFFSCCSIMPFSTCRQDYRAKLGDGVIGFRALPAPLSSGRGLVVSNFVPPKPDIQRLMLGSNRFFPCFKTHSSCSICFGYGYFPLVLVHGLPRSCSWRRAFNFLLLSGPGGLSYILLRP